MKNAAFIIVVNRQYLPGFHVLIHSMRRLGVLEEFDVVAVTTEADLQRDPVMQAAGARIAIVTDEDVRMFSGIPRDGVREHLRRDDIAKYNFLKFYAFRDFGYDFNVLLDCDILCLKPLKVSDLSHDVDIAASPRFNPKTLYPDDIAAESSQDEAHERLVRFWSGYEKTIVEDGINSGVVSIGRGIMSDDIFLHMINLAEKITAGGDQSVIWKFIKSGSCRFQPLHPAFNFNQHCLGHISAMKQVEWINKAVLLHYPGSYPWDADQTMKKISHSIWHQAHLETRRWINRLKG